MRHGRLEHRFVHHMPERLEPGVIYVSMDYATAAHSCCCGCGEEVVTPFMPTGWKITFDGETVSLWPSVGNWNTACRSHYVIKRNRVIEAEPWTDRQTASERRRDRPTEARSDEGTRRGDRDPDAPLQSPAYQGSSLWSRIKDWAAGRKAGR